MNVIQAYGLSRIYRSTSGEEVRAVDCVDLQIPKGQFLVIVGASGSGKTTLLNLLGGLDKPTEGKLVVDSVDLTYLSEEKMVPNRVGRAGE